MKKKSKEEFINDAMKIHGDKYDYSLVEYINSYKKVKIICREHGVFEQLPNNHLNGCDCKKCAYIINSKNSRNTIENFIEKSIKIHGDKYDYSLIKYINNKTSVKIICKEHGMFEQRPDSHLSGRGCYACYGTKKRSNLEFIEDAKKIHGNKYDYSLVKYENTNKKVKIICIKHGIFKKIPREHLNTINGGGCPKCKPNFNLDRNVFIEKSNIIHNNLYDYSLVEYINSHTPVKIICIKHGVFVQKPHKHTLQKQGCPKCKLSKGILKICNILKDSNIEYELEKKIEGCVSNNNVSLRFDIFLPDKNIYIEYDGEQHFRPVENWGGIESFNSVILRDSIKNKFCKDNYIKLIRISYLDDIEKKLNFFIS
jgi:hypothetical protein